MRQYYGLAALHSFSFTLFCMCVYFWARERHGYTDVENLLLGALQGLAYVVCASLGGRAADRFGYDRVIQIGLGGMAATLLVAWTPAWRGTPFLTVLVYTAFIGPTWPSLEAALCGAPGRSSIPQRLGFYNVVWGVAGAGGFFASGFLFRWNHDAVLWAPGLLHLLALAWMILPSRAVTGKASVPPPHRGDGVPRHVKRRFVRTAWVANAVAYFMMTAFNALAPAMGARLSLEPSWTIWLVSSLLFSRSAAFFLFWKWEGWHYRMGLGQVALWSAPLCLAAAFFAPHGGLVLAALTAMGFAMGLTYCTSIYYSLDYGETKGEHGGLHEAVLGLGVFAGPLAGAVSAHATGSTTAAQATLVVLALLISAAGAAWASLRPNPKSEARNKFEV
jgi:MFS family permease